MQEYKHFLGGTETNQARFKTPTEFKRAGMDHWKADAEAATLLAGLMTNDYAGS